MFISRCWNLSKYRHIKAVIISSELVVTSSTILICLLSNNIPCTTGSQYPHCHQKHKKTPRENFSSVLSYIFFICLYHELKSNLVTISGSFWVGAVKRTCVNSPAKSLTFTFAPKLMSSLTCLTSPRIAAMCRGVSPRSFLLLTLSFCREEELGVFFWVGGVCKGWFKVESTKEFKYHWTKDSLKFWIQNKASPLSH